MHTALKLEGTHVSLAAPEDIASGLKAAAAVFAEHSADPRACAAASLKLRNNELLTKEEALLSIIWDMANDKAFRRVTRGWLSRDVDIHLALDASARP